MNDNRPIAIFDSGLGGLTVVRAVRRRLAAESIIYFGDTARVPYGIKSSPTVSRFAVEIVRFLLRFEPKAVVVACNTASAVALDDLRANFRLPIWDVIEPGARAAAAISRRGPIALLATEATVNSQAYPRAIRRHNPDARVIAQAAPLLVPLVEEGRSDDDPIVRLAIEEYLRPVLTGRPGDGGEEGRGDAGTRRREGATAREGEGETRPRDAALTLPFACGFATRREDAETREDERATAREGEGETRHRDAEQKKGIGKTAAGGGAAAGITAEGGCATTRNTAGGGGAPLAGVLLGCTHYPLLAGAIRSVLGDSIELIDSAEQTAAMLADELPGRGLAADPGRAGTLTCLVSDNAERFARVGSRFLGQPIEQVRYVDPDEFFAAQ